MSPVTPLLSSHSGTDYSYVNIICFPLLSVFSKCWWYVRPKVLETRLLPSAVWRSTLSLFKPNHVRRSLGQLTRALPFIARFPSEITGLPQACPKPEQTFSTTHHSGFLQSTAEGLRHLPGVLGWKFWSHICNPELNVPVSVLQLLFTSWRMCICNFNTLVFPQQWKDPLSFSRC